MKQRYRDFNSFLREIHGERVQKITVDAGLTCPNRDGTIGFGGCIYCNERGSGTGAASRGMGISEQIRTQRAFVSKRYHARKFLIYFQSFSNTYAPLRKLRDLYEEALNADEGIVGLSVGTRPDCVTPEILTLLEGYARRDKMIWIEYGLQSSCDATLRRIHRGHDAACFRKAVEMTRNRGIRICAHVILGLPGEGRDEMLRTTDFVANLGLDGIKIHLLYVIRGTPLETLYRQGAYRCLDQEEYVSLVCDVLERLPAGMVIQRLTGDPHRDEFVAPDWCLDKSGTMNLIRETLTLRDTWQGKRHRE